MKISSGVVFLFLIFLHCSLFSQEKVQWEIIISTDCAPDDLRALCELLAVKEIQTDAIIASDGMMAPEEGRIKILEFLNQINLKDIPVGEGIKVPQSVSPHSDFLKSVYWGNPLQGQGNFIPAEKLLSTVVEEAKNPVTIICLGPLTDISEFLKQNPEQKSNIQKIIWYNESIQPLSGTNYEFNKLAADYILNAGVPVYVISNLNLKGVVLSKEYLEKIVQINTLFSKAITESHSNEKIIQAINSGFLKLWDDLVPVYYLYPELFDMEPVKNNQSVSITVKFNVNAVKEKIFRMLSQSYSLEKNIVFDRFPADSSLFSYDVREIMGDVIKKYGKEEWRACVLTNEIHGHLGTYSIIGAKMGILARELLNAEVDRISVTSFAGNMPPLSCMNDGLQMSTGATLGLGMIDIKDTAAMPSAEFSYKGKKIKLTLKKEVYDRIQQDINNGIVKYGNLTQGYWKLIREISLKHWLELDRTKIFEVNEL